jgi:hypothetical protein
VAELTMPIARPIGKQHASLAPLLLFLLLWINGCQSPAPRPAGTTVTDPGWTITRQAGAVSLRSPHQSFWHRARPGAIIPPGSQVVTVDGGRLELASAGDRLTTSGPSRFTLPKSERNGVRVRQDAGSLRYDVESAPKRRFEVQTPHFSTVVKGTIFVISIDRSGSEVFVDEGRVLILDLNGRPLGELTTGQIGRMGAQPGATLEVGAGPGPSIEGDPSSDRNMGREGGPEPSAQGNSAVLEITGVTRASLNAPIDEAAAPREDLSVLERIGNALADLAGQVRPGEALTGGGYHLHNDRNSGGGRESENRAQASSRADGSYANGQGDAQGGWGNGLGNGGYSGHGNGGNSALGNGGNSGLGNGGYSGHGNGIGGDNGQGNGHGHGNGHSQGHGHGHGNAQGHGHDKGHGRGHTIMRAIRALKST